MKNKSTNLQKLILLPTLILSTLLFISCSEKEDKLALGNPGGGSGGGGNGAGGLDQADKKTEDSSQLDKILLSLDATADSVKHADELAPKVFAAVAAEFRSLKPSLKRQAVKNKNKNKNQPNQNSQVDDQLAALMAADKFDIEFLKLELKDVSGSTQHTLELKYKANEKVVKLIEVDNEESAALANSLNGDRITRLEWKDDKKNKIVAIYTEGLGQNKLVNLLIVKRYQNDKVQSINPFVEIKLKEKKSETSDIGDLSSLITFVDPVVNKGFINITYKKSGNSLKFVSNVISLDATNKLPGELSFQGINSATVKLLRDLQTDEVAIEVSIKDNVVAITFLESFLGLF